ncbi:Hypothetical predicted protein [Octopus vulgaris]|uniref:Uncharacterized protein n=1 Tax=Octopus vulgaris TaxID=6645 RepID=A0AA36F986_OCTVU|nr:Hypothetical predicted protein [Octopus vulgaris]
MNTSSYPLHALRASRYLEVISVVTLLLYNNLVDVVVVVITTVIDIHASSSGCHSEGGNSDRDVATVVLVL